MYQNCLRNIAGMLIALCCAVHVYICEIKLLYTLNVPLPKSLFKADEKQQSDVFVFSSTCIVRHSELSNRLPQCEVDADLVLDSTFNSIRVRICSSPECGLSIVPGSRCKFLPEDYLDCVSIYFQGRAARVAARSPSLRSVEGAGAGRAAETVAVEVGCPRRE